MALRIMSVLLDFITRRSAPAPRAPQPEPEPFIDPTIGRRRSQTTFNMESAAAPACPQCKAEMVLRRFKRGDLAGREFWGCSRHPQCGGTRQI